MYLFEVISTPNNGAPTHDLEIKSHAPRAEKARYHPSMHLHTNDVERKLLHFRSLQNKALRKLN